MTAVAPDGSDVRVLLSTAHGGMAHFKLGPAEISRVVAHHTVEELWFLLEGRGEMWLKQNGREQVVAVDSGTCLHILSGTHFQFRSFGFRPLVAVAVTMPPWPGEGEAYEVPGPWKATVKSGFSLQEPRHPPRSAEGPPTFA
jgi:mannose-6-phosphate isomerase-like protein (cupin superfamily)